MTLHADLNYTGKRVLITGAANGFGAATARLMRAHGATLVLADIEADTLAPLAADLGAAAIPFDQADPASVELLAAQAGEIDVLVNNAGILVAKPLLETSPLEVRRLIDTDLVGPILLTRLIGAGMVARGSGVVLSISSQTAFCGGEGRAVYAAAKAAIAQLTRSLAVEWGPRGVRVVSLAPGRSITRMTQETAAPGYTGDRGLSRVPLGRWGTAEEVAKAILFLCSDAASYVTGQTLVADGGYAIG
ncbi:SDR family NAD(P)-dependent oxidoreductase [Siccirubricoccus phaeus]|uniref:SDR family NAD(P)-dependent oxidoreductase n=1 Tax=Siccirubricoccus phaeus TaxID=2595053 RepID=UPI00165C15C3|nr:SDR family oxidoreductase [Siccirubricoccus phaeus]